MAVKLKRGSRVVADVWCLRTPMLDKDGVQRQGWKGPLIKYGYTKMAGTITNFGNKMFGGEEAIMVRFDEYGFDHKLKPEEPKGSCAHTHRPGSIKLETEQDICDMAQIPSEQDLGLV
tara:strand:+ start:4361 stop:4714 length:354 start_codon:yes stop_codon:yes gene_type:complete